MATIRAKLRRVWCWRWLSCGAATLISAVIVLIVIINVRSRDGTSGIAVPSLSRDPLFVPLTLVTGAEKIGAFCLDGSPPGYHLDRGSGSGSDKWIVHLEGGGWCPSLDSCFSRKETKLGSSRYMESYLPFYGILSRLPSSNPDFYNWNRVRVRYCDGASFSGDVQDETQNNTRLLFRGRRIWEGVMNELLAKGLASAKEALLTGCSAGGLATYIHCDDFRALLSKETIVKCMADGGLFLNEKDISGQKTIQSFYQDVIVLQEVAESLQKDCLSKNEPVHCFFPQEIIKNIKTPFFIVNSAYDWWQIQNILVPETSDPKQNWQRCKFNIHHCDPHQIEILHRFRNAMLDALDEFQHRETAGMFINSCFIHCQTWNNMTWHSPTSPRINNKTIAEAVGDWYFE